MSQHAGFGRRAFLRNAGMTALVGAVGASATVNAAAAAVGAVPAIGADPPSGKFDFDTPYSRIGTDSTKWDRPNAQYNTKIIAGMGIADMDFKAAPSITKALTDRLQHENWGYMTMPDSFVEGIVAWNKNRYHLDVKPENVVVTTGVHPGIIAALRAFSPPGSKVLLLTPTYNGFYGDLTYTQTKAEESPLRLVNGKYSIDFEDFERRISHDTNTFILCNPQNPTGNCWSAEDLSKLGEICLRRRVIVLADEIHCDFVSKGQKYTPFASLPNKAVVNNSITFKAASKSFGLAAMKCAWFFSDNQDLLAKARMMNKADLTTLGMIASRAAYSGGEEWLNQVVTYIDGTLEFVESFVGDKMPLIKVAKPQGTYLTWLDCTALSDRLNTKAMAAEANKAKKPGTSDVTPETMLERWFVKNAKVALNPGHTYGLGGANHMRMNIALSRRTVEAALTSMASAMKQV